MYKYNILSLYTAHVHIIRIKAILIILIKQFIIRWSIMRFKKMVEFESVNQMITLKFINKSFTNNYK